MSLQAHEFIKYVHDHEVKRTPSGKIIFRKRKINYGGSIVRMPARLKLMHEFVRYIHDYGMTELLHEDLAAKEKQRRRAKAKRRVRGVL
jgi:hypothetical protein